MKTAFVSFALVSLVFVGCSESSEDTSSSEDQLAQDCSFVKCALPLCSEGQHVAIRGNSCCPTCVGKPSRCATVLCAAIACPEGKILAATGGDCCGHCVPEPAAAECNSNQDCPQIYCIQCPCPVSECRGRQCTTTTPAESTCGDSL